MKWIWILVSVWFTFRILIHRLSLKGHMEEDIRTMPVGSSCMHLRHAITCLWGVFFFYAGFEKPLERRNRSEEHVNMGASPQATQGSYCQWCFSTAICIRWGLFLGKSLEEESFCWGSMHTTLGMSNNCSSKDFWDGKMRLHHWWRRSFWHSWKWYFITDEKLFLAFLEERTSSPTTLDRRL